MALKPSRKKAIFVLSLPALKKFAALLLMLMLALNVSGFRMDQHFCGKKQQYVSFFGEKKKGKCCCGGGERKKKCCTTRHFKMKVDDGKSIAKATFFSAPLLAEILPQPVFFFPQPDFRPKRCAYVVPRIHPPPELDHVRKHVRYGVFRI